jgi:prepilin-type N-terminal cleavage/methylation domain-containing protein/prepilin-type processing-associated H-X9-DG protein
MHCSKHRSKAFTLVELLVVITIIGILIALLLPAVQAAREAARRMQCSNNFKQAALAMHNYHAAKECFPPGVFNPDGAHPLAPSWWGWSTYILPFMEQQAIYDLFDFSTPKHFYSAGNNQAATGKTISAYVCPSDPAGAEGLWTTGSTPVPQVGPTNMCGVADTTDWSTGATSGMAWPKDYPLVDGICGANVPCRMADIQDGTTNTLMIGEVTGAGKGTFVGYYWVGFNILDTSDGINGPSSAPGGVFGGVLPINNVSPYYSGFASWHSGGCNFALADGSIQFVSQNIADAVLKALTTRDGMSRRNYTVPATEVIVAGTP